MAATKHELALKCIESETAQFASSVQQTRAIGTAALAAEPALQQALTALERARLLVREMSVVRLARRPENFDLEPWMEQAHDSTPR
jgi:hypothetical protein